MTRYSVQPRDRIFIKGYEVLTFARNMNKNIGKSTSKNLSGKYRQKPLDHAKQSAVAALKTALKRVVHRKSEATGDLIYNKITDKITKVSKTLPQSNLQIVTNETENIGFYREIPKEKYVSSEKGQKIIDDLRLI